MPGEDGFALLESAPDPRPAIVFATAFDHYAVRAFEEHALDYLLKPFRKERLAEALERARRTREAAEVSARLPRISRRRARRVATRPARSLHRARRAPASSSSSRRVLWFGAEDKLVFAATARAGTG